MGNTIKINNKITMMVAEIFFDFILLLILLYKGINNEARIIPVIIDIKTGFNNKKERTNKINNIKKYDKFLT